MLWGDSLVMKDLETESLWSHLLGKCMQGELSDRQLRSLPSLLTDWATWRELHPETTVLILDRTRRDFTRSLYRAVNDFVVGVSCDGISRAWKFADLEQHLLVNDAYRDTPVVVAFHRPSATPFLYERQTESMVLTFVRKGETVVDEQTQSTWNLQTGMATDGELKGTKLNPLIGITSFSSAWEAFHPNCEYWQPH